MPRDIAGDGRLACDVSGIVDRITGAQRAAKGPEIIHNALVVKECVWPTTGGVRNPRYLASVIDTLPKAIRSAERAKVHCRAAIVKDGMSREIAWGAGITRHLPDGVDCPTEGG